MSERESDSDSDDEVSTPVWDAATGLTDLSQCAAFTKPMVVRGADHLHGLQLFKSLRTLTLIGGGYPDLRHVASLKKLRSLKIVNSTVRDLKPLAGLSELEQLELNFTFVEDLSPIEQLEHLGWLRTFGNPLDDNSFHNVLAGLRTTDVARWGRPCIVESSTDDERLRCGRLFAAKTGDKLVWGTIPTWNATVLKPGPRMFQNIEFLEATADDVDAIVAAPDPAQAPLLTRAWIQPGVEQSDVRFGVRWQAGRGVDVARWLQDASSWLAADEAQRYLRFVSRFPDELFYRHHDDVIRWAVVANNEQVPAWFAQRLVNVLAGARPHERMHEVYLDEWYSLGLIGFHTPERRELYRDQLGLFPIAEHADSTLAIKLHDEKDQKIYDVNRATNRVTPAFDSYAALLDCITALRTNDVVTPAQGTASTPPPSPPPVMTTTTNAPKRTIAAKTTKAAKKTKSAKKTKTTKAAKKARQRS